MTATLPPSAPVLLATYGNGTAEAPAPPPPPTDAQVIALSRKGQADLPPQWAQAVAAVCQRLVFERSLLAMAADYIPADIAAEDDPKAPPGWVIYAGDTLRAAGRAKKPSDRPHWALTADPHDPAAQEACAEARVDAMARGLELAFKERLAAAIAALPTTDEREDAIDGGQLNGWPRLEDGVTLDTSLPVGIGPGDLSGPAASRMEKAGLVEWREGRAHLTERGQRAGQLHARLNQAAEDSVQAEAAATLAAREG